MKGKLLTFVLGIVLGAVVASLWPRFVTPRLPAGLRSSAAAVEGTVIRKQRDGERLLLTIDTPEGAALATFTEKVPEIDLLVEEADVVTLGLGGYEPFLENPTIRGVVKVEVAPESASPPPAEQILAPDADADAAPPPSDTPAPELDEWRQPDEDG